MARLYADEQFPARATNHLRRLGHEVLTVQQTNESKYGDGKSDEEILLLAIELKRAVLTLNRNHFIDLHQKIHWHKGIVICSYGGNPRSLAKKVDSCIRDCLNKNNSLAGVLLRADLQ